MPFNNNINNFIVPAQDAFLYQLVYNQVYGGLTGCTVNINGTTVQMGPNSTIDIIVKSISGGTGCSVSGDRPYVFGDSLQYKYVPQTFVSVWDTSRTSTGSSTATQIRLPLNSAGSYNFIVDWGDGSTDRITTWNQAETTHTYASAGVYQLTITGTIRGFGFVNAGDRLKLLSIFRWGTGFRLGDVNGQFFGCANLDLSEVEDVLNLQGTTNFGSLFRACTRLSTVNRMNEWDVSNVNTLNSTFFESPNFNTYIGDWNTENVTTMTLAFGTTMALGIRGVFNQDISKWNTSKVTNMSSMLQNQYNFNQDISTKVVTVGSTSYIAWDTSNVTDMNFMFGLSITGGVGGSFNQNIGNWNTSKVTNMSAMFQSQINFNQDISTKVVTVGSNNYIAWDTSNVTNMNFFQGGTATNGLFNQNIGNWNTSKVTTMQAIFGNKINFNQDISTKVVTVSGSSYVAWDVGNVTNFASAFNCSSPTTGSFNQNIGNWNTSRVTNMSSMFQNQPNFNQNISTKVVTVSGSSYVAWNTSNVTNMGLIFNNIVIDGEFNQNIGNWNTTRVTNMTQMFTGLPYFNQDISTKVVTISGSSYVAWNTTSATTMNFMFFCYSPATAGRLSGSFNQNIGNWDTRRVTNMSQMFQNQPNFNQDIGTKQVTVSGSSYSAWTVSGVTTMSIMFGITNPNTTGGIIGSFNNGNSPSINNWDVRRLTGATDMFNYQTGFNQPINNWNISGVTTFSSSGFTTGFMFGKTFNDYSTANYDALLIGWATRNVRPNQLLNMGTIKYTSAAVSARNTLTSAPNNWTIIDGGLV
jgi:surface protein